MPSGPLMILANTGGGGGGERNNRGRSETIDNNNYLSYVL